MKKTAGVSGSKVGFRPVLPRKKRRDSALKDGSGGRNIGLKVRNSCSWGSETGNTTKSDSIDMEEKCVVEKTSFNYGEDDALTGEDFNQTPTGSRVKTKKALSKPLGKINFLLSSDENDVFLDTLLELLLLLKNLVNISVHKSFALDIGLDKMIIRVTFTSELSLAQTSKKAEEAKILVNTDLKKLFGHSDWAIVLKKIPVETLTETVCIALFKFGVMVSIKIQLVGLWQKTIVEFSKSKQADLVTACWSILIGKNAVCVARADLDKELWNARD
ncbi:hypothetical protein G9A89_020216 [Geosiphon pyriformis]|nr:hypothetical protein G9A89_020216 [Geosiphon pyriformis]